MEGRLLRTPRMLPLALFSAGLASACGTTPPAPAAPSVVAPTTTETFAGTLTVGGTQFYSFSVAQYGTVNVTLASLDGSDSSPLQVTLAMGRPAARVCREGSAVTTAPGAAAQLTGTFDPGVYCAQVSDIGTLTGSTTFVVTIAHP